VETRSYPGNSQAILGRKQLKPATTRPTTNDAPRIHVMFTKCVHCLSPKGFCSIDNSGNLWLLGGANSGGNPGGNLNDLWEFLRATFILSSAPSALTVDSGGQGTVTLTVTPQAGFTSTVSFICSTLPVGATCDFIPTEVTPSGAPTTQLTISVSTQSSALRPTPSPFLPTAALAGAACLFGWRRRRHLQARFLLAAVAMGLGLISSCGGAGSTLTPVTSTVIVSATGSSISADGHDFAYRELSCTPHAPRISLFSFAGGAPL
jgi:hypothetical protein